jgi:hypothetical protein
MEIGSSKILDLLFGSPAKPKLSKQKAPESFMNVLRDQFQRTTQNLEQMQGLPEGVYSYGTHLSDNTGSSPNSITVV